MRSGLVIVNDGVVLFHELCFDITKYPLLIGIKYGSGRPNFEHWNSGTRLLRPHFVSNKENEYQQIGAGREVKSALTRPHIWPPVFAQSLYAQSTHFNGTYCTPASRKLA